MIFDGPVNKAKIHVLQDIYAIQLTDTFISLFSKIIIGTSLPDRSQH